MQGSSPASHSTIRTPFVLELLNLLCFLATSELEPALLGLLRLIDTGNKLSVVGREQTIAGHLVKLGTNAWISQLVWLINAKQAHCQALAVTWAWQLATANYEQDHH